MENAIVIIPDDTDIKHEENCHISGDLLLGENSTFIVDSNLLIEGILYLGNNARLECSGDLVVGENILGPGTLECTETFVGFSIEGPKINPSCCYSIYTGLR